MKLYTELYPFDITCEPPFWINCSNEFESAVLLKCETSPLIALLRLFTASLTGKVVPAASLAWCSISAVVFPQLWVKLLEIPIASWSDVLEVIFSSTPSWFWAFATVPLVVVAVVCISFICWLCVAALAWFAWFILSICWLCAFTCFWIDIWCIILWICAAVNPTVIRFFSKSSFSYSLCTTPAEWTLWLLETSIPKIFLVDVLSVNKPSCSK